MTLEEAAEEILKGAFTTCTRCNGDGTVLDAPAQLMVHDMVSRTGRVCSGCGGTGEWRRGDYLRACCLLGIEPVEAPKRRQYPIFDPVGFKKLLEQVDRKEYLGVWHEPERCDTADAMAYAMRPTPESAPVLSVPRCYWPGHFKL